MKMASNQRSKYFEIAMWISVILAILMFSRQLLRLPDVVFELQDYPRGFKSVGIDYKSVHNLFLVIIADMSVSGIFLITFGSRRWYRRLFSYAFVAFWVYVFVRLAAYFFSV